MTDQVTRTMLPMYIQQALPTLFLSAFFRSPPQNFHTSEEVEWDVQRMTEDVAIVVTDLSTGGRYNADDFFTNKKLKPPIYNEIGTLNAFDMIKRTAGQNPYQQPDFQANAIVRAFRIFRKLEGKIRRAIELMASQVLQTGQLTLRDQNGVALYTIDFMPKVSHFPTAGETWGTANADPLADLLPLSTAIRSDGLVSPNVLVYGEKAFEAFIDDEKVQKRLDNRGMNVGQVAPEHRGQGGTFQGFVWIGNYRFEMWTYDGRYRHPETGASTPFVNTGSVMMLSRQTRLDLTFGAIPVIVPPEARVLPFLPPRLSNTEGGMDLTTHGWIPQDGSGVKIMAGTRPMTLPTAIDAFGCLDTGLTDD